MIGQLRTEIPRKERKRAEKEQMTSPVYWNEQKRRRAEDAFCRERGFREEGKKALRLLSLRQWAAYELIVRCDPSGIHEPACDHARLTLALLETGLADEGGQGALSLCRAECSDINAGPVENARRNLRELVSSGNVRLFRADGLDGHDVRSGDLIALMGLGAYSALDILRRFASRVVSSSSEEALLSFELLIQVQSKIEDLRSCLRLCGARIKEELLLEDRHFAYPLFLYSVEKSGEFCRRLAAFPPPFLKHKENPAFTRHLREDEECASYFLLPGTRRALREEAACDGTCARFLRRHYERQIRHQRALLRAAASEETALRMARIGILEEELIFLNGAADLPTSAAPYIISQGEKHAVAGAGRKPPSEESPGSRDQNAG